MMCAPNRPCAHDWMPFTWSCQNTVPLSTSEYQRYWVNSTDTGSPTLCAEDRPWSNVSWLVPIAVILRISTSDRTLPIAMNTPTRRLVVLVTFSVVAFADEAV